MDVSLTPYEAALVVRYLGMAIEGYEHALYYLEADAVTELRERIADALTLNPELTRANARP